MAKELIPVHHDIFVWARERRGYSIEDAARKADIAIATLASIEVGEQDPTAAQIRRAAEAYIVSPAVFFLPKVPEEQFTPPKDFRSLDGELVKQFSPELRKEIERIEAQREALIELNELGIISSPPIDIELNPRAKVDDLAAQIETWLFAGDKFERRPTLNDWIDLIERRGVLVSQMSRIPIDEVRGFCVSEQPFPFIVLNGADVATARVFTLLHELTHVLMYQHTENLRGVHGKELEIRCNAVAAAVLLPASAVLAMPEIAEVNGTKEWTLEELSSVARPYHVSREAMARRLVTLGKLSSAHYQSIRVTLIERKKKATSSEGGGPPHFETLLRNLGPTYVRAVLTARQRGLISESRLGDYIFGRVQHAPSMAEKLGVDL